MVVEFGVWISLFCYLIGWAAQFSAVQKKINNPTLGNYALYVASLLHLGILIYVFTYPSWPKTLIPDLFNAIAWFPTFVYLAAKKYIKNEISTTSIPLFTIALLLMSVILLESDLPTINQLQEAPLIQKTLFLTHVSTMFAGYVLFGFSCFSSIIYLYQEHQIKTKLVKLLVHQFPSLAKLDQISYRSVVIGFIFLTTGLILGAALSDGLQSLRSIFRLGISFLIWLLYAFFLIERIFQTTRRFSAIWSLIGFLLVLTSLVVEMIHIS